MSLVEGLQDSRPKFTGETPEKNSALQWQGLQETKLITRRELLIRSASLAAAVPAAKFAAAIPPPRRLKSISLHLFQVTPADAVETCRGTVAMGYKEMEATYKEYQACSTEIAPTPLKKVSIEAQGTEGLFAPGREDALNRIFEDVSKWGFPYIGVNHSGRQIDDELKGKSYLDRFRIFADRFNCAGERARAAGIKKLLYHNAPEGFEPSEGTFGHQIVWDALDRNNCGIQMDIYWFKQAGLDPAVYLKKFTGRVPAIHMKDIPPGMPVAYTHPAPEAILDIGNGIMDWPAILRAAEDAGVEHYSVEPADVKNGAELLVHAKKSYDYLSKLEF